jgi:hypothetical protein
MILYILLAYSVLLLVLKGVYVILLRAGKFPDLNKEILKDLGIEIIDGNPSLKHIVKTFGPDLSVIIISIILIAYNKMILNRIPDSRISSIVGARSHRNLMYFP